MTHSARSGHALTVVSDYFNQFREAWERQNYGVASDLFTAALSAHPGATFRHFMTRAGAALQVVLYRAGTLAAVAAMLDELISEHPAIHALCSDDPGEIDHQVRLRESNIDKGLPSILMVTQAKAASAAVGQIFHSGFELPSFAYSLADVAVIESWARDFARGGACYTNHLFPYAESIARLKRSGVSKVIVHLRDPRQSLLSAIHHVETRPDTVEIAQLKMGFNQKSIEERADQLLEFYISRIRFIDGWIEAQNDLNVMFSTFEEFVSDRDAFVQRYVDFYGGPPEHFSYQKAVSSQAGKDYRFRAGRTDEWREVFSPKYAARLSQLLPDDLKQRFGWPRA
jgi:Sulfotransferase domain